MIANDETAIYEEDDLEHFIKKEGKVTISSNLTDGVRSVKSKAKKKSDEEIYFQEITEQLQKL